MKVYDYRIVETIDLNTLKPYFLIQNYSCEDQQYYLHSDAQIETLQEAQEAVRLLRKYKEPIYHYVE